MSTIQEYIGATRMRDLIDHNPMLLMALSRFGISLGFGDRTIAEICSAQQVDCDTFLAVANYISFGILPSGDISIASLMKYLESAHSYFLDFCLPRIRRSLIEAIDCSGRDEVAMLILQFYDSYSEEVRRHMEYENNTVFVYVRSLLGGALNPEYSISVFASGHHSIHNKLQELKELIVRYLPQRNNNLLNNALFSIINCEQDLVNHCKVEDDIFVPAVARQEAVVIENVEKAVDESPAEENTAEELSSREREIVACVARGLSNKQIADRLCLSVHTVTTHRRNIAQKLQIHSAAGLAIYAVVNGLVAIDELKDASRK